jgi:hypothetical protein
MSVLPDPLFSNPNTFVQFIAAVMAADKAKPNAVMTWKDVKQYTPYGDMKFNELKSELGINSLSLPINNVFELLVAMGYATPDEQSGGKAYRATDAGRDWYFNWTHDKSDGEQRLAAAMSGLWFMELPTANQDDFAMALLDVESSANQATIESAYELAVAFGIRETISDDDASDESGTHDDEDGLSDEGDPSDEGDASDEDGFSDEGDASDEDDIASEPEPEPATPTSEQSDADEDESPPVVRDPDATIATDPLLGSSGGRRQIPMGGGGGLSRLSRKRGTPNPPAEEPAADATPSVEPETNTPSPSFEDKQANVDRRRAGPRASDGDKSEPRRPVMPRKTDPRAPRSGASSEPERQGRRPGGSRMEQARAQQSEQEQPDSDPRKNPMAGRKPSSSDSGSTRKPLTSGLSQRANAGESRPAGSGSQTGSRRGSTDNRRYGGRAKPSAPPNQPAAGDNSGDRVMMRISLPDGSAVEITQAMVNDWKADNGGSTQDAIEAMRDIFLNQSDSDTNHENTED